MHAGFLSTGLVLEATWLVNPLEEALTAGGAPSGHSLGYNPSPYARVQSTQ